VFFGAIFVTAGSTLFEVAFAKGSDCTTADEYGETGIYHLGEVNMGNGQMSGRRPRAGVGNFFEIFALKWCILVQE